MSCRQTWARVGALSLAGALTVTGVVGGAGVESAHAATPRVLDRGHVDLTDVAVTYESTTPVGLRLDLKDDTELYDAGSVRIDPSSALIHLGEAAHMEWPLEDSPLFAYGQEIWLADQSGDMQAEVPWPGWNTERVPSGILAGDKLDLRMELVEGPGDLVVFTMNDSGEVSDLYLDSREGPGGVTGLPVGSHRHAGWIFTAPGEYRLTASATGSRASDGQRVTSAVETYRFCIGDLSGCPSAGGTPTTEPTPTPTPAPTTPAEPTPTPTVPAPTPTPTTPDDSGETRVVGSGHVDLATALRDDRLSTVVRDSSQPGRVVDRSLAKVVFHVRPGARSTVPERDAYGFLGKAGAPVWLLPQTQAAGLLWPGWSTEGVARDRAPDGVVWQLDRVRGLRGSKAPGQFALYDTDSFGVPRVLLDSSQTPSRFGIPPRVHAHGTWAFTAEGAYCLDFTRAATLASGRQVRHTGTLLVAVGDVATGRLDPGQCAPAVAPTKPIPPAAAGAISTGNSGGTGTATGGLLGGAGADGTGADGKACVPDVPGGAALASGHADIATRLIDGKAALTVKDGTRSPAVWREPSASVVVVPDSARATVPPSGFSFLGASGASVWQIPQTQRSGIVWLGWNTQGLDPAQVRGAVTWRLDQVEGPGELSIYTLDAFGSPELLLRAGRSLDVPLGTHAHANWAFSKPGTYRLRMTQSFTLVNGQRASDSETLAVVVGKPGERCDGAALTAAAAQAGKTAGDPSADGLLPGLESESTTDGGPASSSGGLPLRLVAGLVAGNVLALAAITGLLFWFLRRQLALMATRLLQ